jgi:hypothetical protein
LKTGPVAVGFALLLAASSAAAQGNLEQAKALFDGGAAMYDKAHYDEAILAFEAAYRIAPRPGILFSIAQAHKKQFFFDKNPEHLREALRGYREYVEKTPNGGRRGEAVASIAELEPYTARFDMSKVAAPAEAPKVTTILVQTGAASAEVSVDGKAAADDTLHFRVSPGKHKVRVAAPGFAAEEQEIAVAEGEYRPLLFNLKELPARLSITTESGAQVSIDGRIAGNTPLLRPLDVEPGNHLVTVAKNGFKPYSEEIEFHHGESRTLAAPLPRTGQRVASYVLIGAGAAGLIAGGVVAALAFHDQTQAQDIADKQKKQTLSATELGQYNDLVGRRDDFKKVSAVVLGGAVVAGATGFVLYAFDQPTVGQSLQHRDEKKPALPTIKPGRDMEMSFVPALAPGLAGGTVVGRF